MWGSAGAGGVVLGWGVPGSSKERLVAMTDTSVDAGDITGYVIATTGGETLLTPTPATS
ncbi:hypothetical protein GCM10017779_68690 [Streptomyces capillispiralis]|nr:hypothetical protein GCM10017779_68690 [Streptomyces capillispiralis]